MAGERKQGQPTPEQVVKDAFRSISPEELAAAVPAQTPEDDMTEDAYTPIELAEAATDFSVTIMHMLGIKDGDQIRERYTFSHGRQFVRHFPLPEGNHSWRVVSAEMGMSEVRTGPFFDPKVKKTYEPEIKVTMRDKTHPIPPSGREAYQAGVRIIIAAIPQSPVLPIRG